MFRAKNTVKGIALVAVLAVLTVLAIMAATFAVHSNTETTTAKNNVRIMEARAIADSGVEHVKSLLWYDTVVNKSSSDSFDDYWYSTFDGSLYKKNPEVDVDGIKNNGPKKNGKDAVWIPVHDENGSLIGRYAVVVEDECGKVNLNIASMVPPLKPNQGLDTRELYLGDGKGRGIPFSKKACQRLLKKRYGPNGVPGAAGDDNYNNYFCMSDELDNNSNGKIDEIDEGINEWAEYVPSRPYGDDRSFFNMSEVLKTLMPNTRPSRANVAILRKYGTLVSKNQYLRWNKSDQKWVDKKNINICTPRQFYKTLRNANEKYNFEGTANRLRRLAACMSDYRDENNVLSTISSKYGVEAVCFNEVMANEGSKIRQTYRIQSYRKNDDRVHNIAYYYGNPDYRKIQSLSDDNVANREKFFGTGEVAFPIYSNKVKRVGSTVLIELRDFPLRGAGYYNGFRDFKNLLKSRGGNYITGEKIRWPENIWANGYMAVFKDTTKNAKPSKVFKIKSSNRKNQIFLYGNEVSAEDLKNLKTRVYRYAQIRTWTWEKSCYAEHPKVSDWFVFAGLEPRDYYRVYIQETNLETPTGDSSGGNKHSDVLDVDGVITKSSEQEIHKLRYKYKDGEVQRADSKGFLDVYVTSSADCSPRNRNRFNAAYFARPDIIELMNISSRPISLRGWSFVANTGSLSYDLGKVKNAFVYSKADGRRIEDPNPVIKPNEYFYLCNNAEIFDYDFGSVKDGNWGGNANERMPVYEFDDDQWGVRFKIKSLRESFKSSEGWTTFVQCDNEQWKNDQFENELAEFQTDRTSSGNQISPDGVRALVTGNSRNTLEFTGLKLKEYSDIKPGDYVMIVGLPRIGGFVSMTLKNEYEQIAARLVEYGDPGKDASKDPDSWIGWSSEKDDPTREEWILRKQPTFGGTVAKSRNHVAKLKAGDQSSIKNGPFSSVGEVNEVRNVTLWERKTKKEKDVKAKKVIQGAAEFFCTSGIRLDAEEENANIQGWSPAFGESEFNSRDGATLKKAKWEKDIWANQSISILTGKNRGEVFAISGNTANKVNVDGRSVPNRKNFSVRKGDKFSIGPGYSTSLFYTRKETQPGIWEWKNKGIPKGTYDLTLFGLNDSIKTTEFLEENHNTPLNVYLFDFENKKYDLIKKNVKYNKNDSAAVGKVLPKHISPSGGIKLKLIPHNLKDIDGSGFAWFDCAYISPMPAIGLININTASRRVLQSLNKITPELADNIFAGKNNEGQNCLKPYKTISDLMNVRGMSVEVFSALANLITVRSDQFNVYVFAQRIDDVNHDGIFQPKEGEKVIAVAHERVLLDRTNLLTEDDKNKRTISVIEKEN